MLKRIKATNFQGHSNVDIRFHPGVNVITGQSEAGKSAIVRIIRWVTQNRPSGKSIVKIGENITKAKLFFDNGIIKKERNKSTVTYTIKDAILKAIGRDVPYEVSSISNIEDKNIQTQHNPYFLLVKSPGEIAKELNDLAGISVIDKLFTAINGELRNTKAEQINITETIEDLTVKLSEVTDTKKLEEKVNAFAKLLKANKRKQNMLDAISEAIADIEDIDNEERKNSIQLQHGKTIKQLTNRIEKLLANRKKLKSITEHIQNITDTNNRIEQVKEEMDRLEKQKKNIMRNMKECPLCGTILRRMIADEKKTI